MKRYLAALAAVYVMSAASAANIDTAATWNGVDEITDFGPSVTATYGQTITAAVDDGLLLSFTFFARLTSGTAFPMRAKVYRWDSGANRATGAPLFESGPVTVSAATFQPYTFNIPGGLPVVPGQMYVMFVTVSQDLPLPPGFGPFGAEAGSGTYSSGQFVFQNNVADTSRWTGQAWVSLPGTPTRDLAFSATFSAPAATSPTPVPTLGIFGYALLAAALAAMGMMTRRR